MEWQRKPAFLYLRWLEEELSQAACLEGGLSPRQYAAALLQAYLGGAAFPWVAEAAGVTVAELRRWRLEPAFLRVMDDSKARFAVFFLSTLREQDFSPAAYGELAAEFVLLEDSLKVRVRTELYDSLRTTAARVWSRRVRGQSQEMGELAQFHRLTAFFAMLEPLWPGPAGPRLAREFLPLARAVGWPLAEAGMPLLAPPGREEVLAALLPVLKQLAAKVAAAH